VTGHAAKKTAQQYLVPTHHTRLSKHFDFGFAKRRYGEYLFSDTIIFGRECRFQCACIQCENLNLQKSSNAND